MCTIILKKSVRFTATLAVLSAGFLISASAHAGLLGGGSGALGGAFGGGFTPRSIDIDGHAAGQVQRGPVTLPRGDKVKDAVAQGSAKADAAKATAGADAAAAKQTGSDGAAMAPTGPSTAKPVSSSGAGAGAGLATRRGEASAAGTAQASRSDRSIGAESSVNATMQR